MPPGSKHTSVPTQFVTTPSGSRQVYVREDGKQWIEFRHHNALVARGVITCTLQNQVIKRLDRKRGISRCPFFIFAAS
jgi:hypothetical protein